MNSLVENELPFPETQYLRYEVLKTLTADDLAYKLPGDNATLEPVRNLLHEEQPGDAA